MVMDSFKQRVYFISLVFFCCLLFLLYRVTYLHLFFELPLYKTKTAGHENRGIIFDADGNTLAISQEEISVGLNPSKIKNPVQARQVLKKYFSLSELELARILSGNSFTWIQRKISKQIGNAIKKEKVEGITIQKEFKRYYPERELFSHVVGFADIDNIGKEGIEASLDNYLSGNYIPISDTDSLNSFFQGEIKGNSAHLTVLRKAQITLDREIKKAWLQTGAKGIFGILTETTSGKIIALVSHPNFDPNHLSESSARQRRNRAIQDIFEPGSTFKIFIAAALLEEGLVNDEDKFFCPGYIKKEDHVFRCWAKHGPLTFAEVIKKSCNVGMIQAVERINSEKLYLYLNKFGFGEKTNIRLNGEEKGILHFPNKWSSISPFALAIGYEISITGIQLVRAAASIANHGALMEPQLVELIEGSDEIALRRFRPRKVQKVISGKTAQRLLRMLHSATLPGGTATLAVPDKMSIAGKTGTAQKSFSKEGYAEGKFTSSFVGLFPFNNPRFALLIVIDEPAGDYWGGSIAAPIFKNVVTELGHQLNLQDYVKGRELSAILVQSQDLSRLFNSSTFPDFQGLSKREALLVLHELKKKYPLHYTIKGSGYVIIQIPAAGSPFEQLEGEGKEVELFLK
jgi:cell division protein FtsI/penicillin-binding protein 2